MDADNNAASGSWTTCADARDLLSARLDGELASDEVVSLDIHLSRCADCETYADQIGELHIQLRTRTTEPVPDIASRVLGAHAGNSASALWVRLSLLWVAIVLAVPSAMAMITGAVDGIESHSARHLGSFGLALAFGFVYAAWRPTRAGGLLPLTAALVVFTVTSAVADLAQGRSSALPESAHLAEIVGLALLWELSGRPGLGRLRPTRRTAHRLNA